MSILCCSPPLGLFAFVLEAGPQNKQPKREQRRYDMLSGGPACQSYVVPSWAVSFVLDAGPQKDSQTGNNIRLTYQAMAIAWAGVGEVGHAMRASCSAASARRASDARAAAGCPRSGVGSPRRARGGQAASALRCHRYAWRHWQGPRSPRQEARGAWPRGRGDAKGDPRHH